MGTWTSDELARIEQADELELAFERRDGGGLPLPVTNPHSRPSTIGLVPR
ncbi:MAG TPA: hypothetical protein VI011_09410 [Asanoa sp.]